MSSERGTTAAGREDQPAEPKPPKEVPRLRQPPRWPRLLIPGLWLVVIALVLDQLCYALLPWWSLVLAVGLLCSGIAVGVMCQSCGLFARPCNGLEGEQRRLALTFDDGPDPDITPQVLALLSAHQQRATFFLIGRRAKKHPELVQRILAEGHELANHSLDHVWHLSLWRGARIAEQLRATNELLQQLAGQAPRCFRPPAAVLSPAIERGARLAGLRLVGYTHRAGDGSSLVPQQIVRQRVLAGLQGGAVIVLHDAKVKGAAPVSLALLPELLGELQRCELTSVPLSELWSLAEQDSH